MIRFNKSIFENMWLTSLVMLLCLGLTWFIYTFYTRPKHMIASYTRKMTQLGYRVYQYGFVFLGSSQFKKKMQNAKEYNNPFHYFMHQLNKYDVAVGNSLNRPLVVVLNPKLVKSFLAPDKLDVFHKSTLLSTVSSLTKNGLIFLEGQQWKKSKKLLSKVFNFKLITSQIPLICQLCDEKIVKYEKTNEQGHHTLNLLEFGVDLFASVVLTQFLGMKASNESYNGKSIQTNILELVHTAIQMSFTDPLVLMLGPSWVKMGVKKAYRDYETKNTTIRSILKRLIANLRSQKEGSGKNTIVEAIFQENKQQGCEVYSEKEIIDQVMTFIFAGAETTSNYFIFTILAIYQNPDVLAKVRKQIEQNLQEGANMLELDQLKKLKYIDCVQTEVSRVYGPVEGIFDRVAREDTLIGDLPIVKGTCVTFHSKPMFYSEDYFESASQFKPQRWQAEDKTGRADLIALAFSGGPKTCIGKHLALLQSKIAIVKFIQRYSNIEEISDRIYVHGLATTLQSTEVKVTRKS